MSGSHLIVRADEVEGFALPGDEATYCSQCLVDRDGVGSTSINVNRFTLKPGRSLKGVSHPVGNDECYYVLRGRATLTLGGDPRTGEGAEVHEIGPDMAVFLPGGTYHALDNPHDEDLVILTMWPRPPEPGANHIYDARKRAWGTAFRTKTAR